MLFLSVDLVCVTPYAQNYLNCISARISKLPFLIVFHTPNLLQQFVQWITEQIFVGMMLLNRTV